MRIMLTLCIVFVYALNAFALDWDPIPDSQLSLQEPRLDPDADAELLFRKVWIKKLDSLELEQYCRIKIYTLKGVEEQTTIDLNPSQISMKIINLYARTIKSDGRIIELEKKDIFERTLIRANRSKIKMKSFSMPKVEPGDIIEYKFKIIDSQPRPFFRIYLQQLIPTWVVNVFFNPSFTFQTFNVPNHEPESASDHLVGLAYEGIPAFKEDNYMPPENQVQSWIYFTDQTTLGTFILSSDDFLIARAIREMSNANRGVTLSVDDRYWKNLGLKLYDYFNNRTNQIKADRTVKKKAKDLISELTDPKAKIQRILDFCLSEIKNISNDPFAIAAEKRVQFKENKKPSDTLKQQMGTGEDINYLFVALLNAIDIEARLALSSGRDDIFFNKKFRDPTFLDHTFAAVRLKDTWNFFDPATPYLEDGMLSWPEEDVYALVIDDKNPEFVTTPLSTAERNRTIRKAIFKLSADGTLEGTIEETLLGQPGFSRRTVYNHLTDTERQDDFEAIVQERLSNAEITDLRFGNVTDAKKPFVANYRITIPGYAESSGKRLFLQPAFFQRNVAPYFVSNERTHDIYFPYPWSEYDEVLIEIPKGFELENAEKPLSFPIPQIGEYKVTIGVTTDQRRLIYKRDFHFGDNGNILLPAQSYANVKKVFDLVHEMDNHVITLRDKSLVP